MAILNADSNEMNDTDGSRKERKKRNTNFCMKKDKKRKDKKLTYSKIEEDARFKDMYTNPKFFPVKRNVNRKQEKLLASILEDDDFVLFDGRDKMADKQMKQALKDIYVGDKQNEQDSKAKKLLEEIDEVDDDSDDSVELNRKHFQFDKKLESSDDESNLPMSKAEKPKSSDSVYDFEVNEEDEEEEIEDIYLQEQKNDLWHLLETSAYSMPDFDDSEATHRLAVVAFDWNVLTAEDFFVAFDSMKPAGGKIESVTIYLSQFGKEQLERESVEGPGQIFKSPEQLQQDLENSKLIQQKKFHDKLNRLVTKKKNFIEKEIKLKEDDQQVLDGDKVREYEMNRLKYYFVEIVCDSPETALTLFKLLNGLEIEGSNIPLDLKFLANEQTFEDREILGNVVTEKPRDYKPKQNVSSKQQVTNSEVTLTWEGNHSFRDKVLRTKEREVSDYNLLKQYLGNSDSESDSESDSDDDREESVEKKKEEALKKRKILLSRLKSEDAEFDQLDKVQPMEVTFKIEDDFGKEISKKLEEKTKQNLETVWETKERHRKLLKKMKKLERKKKFQTPQDEKDYLGTDDVKKLVENADDHTIKMKGFNAKKDADREMSRRKNPFFKGEGQEDSNPVDIQDERFRNKLLQDPDFNLDPTNRKFQKNVATEVVLKEKQQFLKEKQKEKKRKRTSSGNKPSKRKKIV